MSTPTPGSAEWATRVTASKVAAILGLSPWESPYSMWLKMRGDITSDDGSNATAKSRGHYLEEGVIRWWLDQHHGASVRESQPWLPRDEWAAATPDVTADIDGRFVVMDAKTAAYDDDWTDERGDPYPPPYYLAQSVWQMWCADADEAWIAVLHGRGLKFAEYRIARDRDLEASIVARCKAFHDSLTDDEAAPDLDDTTATYEAIRRLHPDIDRDLSVEIDHTLAHDYVRTDQAMKDAEAAQRATRSRLLAAMGRARLAKLGDLTVARRQPRGESVSLVRVAKHVSAPDLKETA